MQAAARKSRLEVWEEQQRTISGHMVWKDQPFYRAAYERWGLEIEGAPEIRNFFLQSALRSLDALDGDVAECGTRHGKSALYMLMASERRRSFWLFDSFEGLSDPLAEDKIESVIDGRTGARLFKVDFAKLQERFAPYENVRLMRGWIPDRFPEVADRRFAFVHIDVDLYQPTRDSFEFFYDRLVEGGMMVCDDYGSRHYPGARLAVDEFFADRPEKPVELPQGQCFIVKRD